MPESLSDAGLFLLAWQTPEWLANTINFLKVLAGFSIIIFVHELGHFLAAKWVDVRVDRFAVGFGPRLIGYRRGEGLTFGGRPDYTTEELTQRGYGETDYCFRAFPVGGYVKMLGQDDIVIDEKTGDVQMTDDPRAFPRKPVGSRMIVASAGVIFNLLFAALLLMGVFLAGKESVAPEVGAVIAESPADGQLQVGDQIRAIDGKTVRSWFDILTLTAFANHPLNFSVERDGAVVDGIHIQPEKDRDGLGNVGILPAFNTTAIQDALPSPGSLPENNIRIGDRIIRVDGVEVTSAFDIIKLFEGSDGRELEVVALRPVDSSGKTEEHVLRQRARIAVRPPEALETGASPQPPSILGMVRRLVVGDVSPGMAAHEAGLESGDVIAAWGPIVNPTYQETLEVIRANAGRPIPVTVERPTPDGFETHKLNVTPRRPFSVWEEKPAMVGVAFTGIAEENRAVVAEVVPGSPAASLNMPRGAVLVEMDGRPVSDWYDVLNGLRAAAGREIEVVYTSGGAQARGRMLVPSSLVNELKLPYTAEVREVNGERSIAYTGADGKQREVSLPSLAALTRMLLARAESADPQTGEVAPVAVKLTPARNEPPIEVTFTPRTDNFDPWQLRIGYAFDAQIFDAKKTMVHSGNNPLLALYMGGEFIAQHLQLTYAAFIKMASREVGMQQVAGPVGIVGMAMQQAQVGWTELTFFLAYLSISLAVINFLPVPVLDGGLMVFLIIEKIKGKPLSFKTQMISTLVGLAAILLLAVFVTIQDIGRLIG